MNKSVFTASLLLIFVSTAIGQNLPSFLSGKNINSTFSITAYDPEANEWGVAVATDNIYVGNSTIYIEPNVGAFSVIAETEPAYGIIGLRNLKVGHPIEDALLEVIKGDNEAHFRQVAGIDRMGNTYAYTGASLKFWKGQSGSLNGENHIVIGNQLSDDVLSAMSETFMETKGTLAHRLLTSLQAGQDKGGQISGKQSAALVVKGNANEWFNQIDLRVDHSTSPIDDLQKLLDFHYGRIWINQALFAHRAGHEERALMKLQEASTLINGWTGMYTRMAMASYLIQGEDQAISWIEKGLNENPNWSINLPAFYFLRDHPKLVEAIHPDNFEIADWVMALQGLSQLGRELEVIELGNKLVKKNMQSSYLHFVIGRSYHFEKDKANALKHLTLALTLDPQNVEARSLKLNIEG